MNVQRVGSGVAAVLGRDSAIVRVLRPAYEYALLALSGGRGIPWTINGEEYQIDPRRRTQLGSDYDAPVAAYLRARVRPGDLCYDVGANVGVYVLQLARWSAPTGQVIAFEPNPGARRVLEQHVRWNSLSPRVRVVPAAVSDAPGRAQLHAVGADGMARLGAENRLLANRTKPLPAEVIALDEFAAQQPPPQWIVVDVEGYELAVLRGARRLLLGEPGRRPRLVVEMHPAQWPSLGDSRDTAAQLVRSLRLTAKPLTGQSDPFSEHGSVALEPA